MKAYVVTGLAFGDEGKGSIVDALVRRFKSELVVRYSGGCQCGHNVYNNEGQHHTFSQFGSGTFVPGVKTLLSKDVIVSPLNLVAEAKVLYEKGIKDALGRVWIDKRALMTTPYHRAVNRLRELARGNARHGSCGMGVGETVGDAILNPDAAIRMGDMDDPPAFSMKLAAAQFRMQKIALGLNVPDTEETMRQLSTFRYDVTKLMQEYCAFYLPMKDHLLSDYTVGKFLNQHATAVFEGAQGVLLDEHYGFYPYTTWSTTTARNAKLMLEEAEIFEPSTTIGVLRSHMTRHGAGPFVAEYAEMGARLDDINNPHNPWQENIRFGALDFPALRYALAVNGPVDCLAVTHCDRVWYPWPVVTKYATPVLTETAKRHQAGWSNWKDCVTFMAEITKAMQEPVDYKQEMIKSRGALFAAIAEQLCAPIGIVSNGPDSADKVFVSELKPA